MPGIARGTGVAVELRQYPYHFNRNGLYSWEIEQKDIHVIALVIPHVCGLDGRYDIRVMVLVPVLVSDRVSWNRTHARAGPARA